MRLRERGLSLKICPNPRDYEFVSFSQLCFIQKYGSKEQCEYEARVNSKVEIRVKVLTLSHFNEACAHTCDDSSDRISKLCDSVEVCCAVLQIESTRLGHECVRNCVAPCHADLRQYDTEHNEIFATLDSKKHKKNH